MTPAPRSPARILVRKRQGPPVRSPSPSISGYRHPGVSSPNSICENTLGSASHGRCAFHGPLLSPAPTRPSVPPLTFPGLASELRSHQPHRFSLSLRELSCLLISILHTPTVPLGDCTPHSPPYRLCGGRGLGGLECRGGIVRRKSLLVAPGSRVLSQRRPPDWASDGRSSQLLQGVRAAVSQASHQQKVSVPGIGPDLAAYLGSVFTVSATGTPGGVGPGLTLLCGTEAPCPRPSLSGSWSQEQDHPVPREKRGSPGGETLS